MKIAILSTNQTLGGAATVTSRLADGLARLGHQVTLICARTDKTVDKGALPYTVVRVNPLLWKMAFVAERAELLLRYGVNRKDLFRLSTARFGLPVWRMPEIQQADRIIISWTCQGLLSLKGFENILKLGKPTLYWMHDLWGVLPLAHIPSSGPSGSSDPFYNGDLKKIGRINFKFKQRLFAYPNLRCAAVSTYQAEVAELLMPGSRWDVLPHPIPMENFRIAEKTDEQGLRTIVMAAARLDDPIKDLPTAVASLNLFAERHPQTARQVKVVFAGELRNPRILESLKIPYETTGLLTAEQLRELFSHASVIISSSSFETMGATLMEGLASGAIAATFGEGGQKDIVIDGVNGFVAEHRSPNDLEEAIYRAVSQSIEPTLPSFLPEVLREDIAKRFSPEAVAQKVLL